MMPGVRSVARLSHEISPGTRPWLLPVPPVDATQNTEYCEKKT